ncbi:MAG: dihydroorotate dehydrogenase electron transfer subunit [Desulfobulbus sp.]|nr:dihydroorotate dehydrogenase electron transfer subunit [Desulfobulbus sp.]
MSEFQEKSRVVAVEQLADTFYRLTLSAPQIASSSQPGQFVMAACGPYLDPLLRRPFSVHRRCDTHSIQLLFRVVGRGTELLAAKRPGDVLHLIGPLGRGFDIDDADRVCLVGGGIGIAPLLFLAEELRLSQRTCTVLLGSRTAGELHQLTVEFNALGCEVEVATDDGSAGYHGLVADLLGPCLTGVKRCYACGPTPMMARTAQLCLAGRIPCQVSLEAHMACGLGACLGCTVHGTADRYLHICRQGPVLNAEEVAWNR